MSTIGPANRDSSRAFPLTEQIIKYNGNHQQRGGCQRRGCMVHGWYVVGYIGRILRCQAGSSSGVRSSNIHIGRNAKILLSRERVATNMELST